MVSSQEEEVLWVFNLVTEEEEDGLETLFASVDVIPEEKIIGGRREAAHLKQPDEVRILPMHVTNDLDRRRELDERWLVEEYLSSSLTNGSDLCVLEAQRLADFACIANV